MGFTKDDAAGAVAAASAIGAAYYEWVKSQQAKKDATSQPEQHNARFGGGCRCGGIFGGNEVDSIAKVMQYPQSVSYKIKADHASALITIFEEIGVKFTNKSDNQAILRDICASIPSSDRTGSNNPFNRNLDKQPGLIKRIVDIVNNVVEDMYGTREVIDPNAGDSTKLGLLIQWVNALCNGFISERDLVNSAVTELVENIKSAAAINDAIYDRMKNFETKKPDEFAAYKRLYTEAKEAYNKHLQILVDFLNVQPKSYTNLIDVQNKANMVIENGRVRVESRSSEYGDAMSYMLSLLKSNTELSQELQEQLKQLSIDLNKSIQEYSFGEFEEQVISKIRKLDANSSPEEISKYEKAAKALRDTFIALKISTGGAETTHGIGTTVKTYTAQQDDRERDGLRMVKEYSSTITGCYFKFFTAVKTFTNELFSKGIKMDMDKLSNSLSNIATLMENHPKIDLELLELSEYSNTRANKEVFLGYFDSFCAALKTFGSQHSDVSYSQIVSEVESITKTIQHYSTLINSKNVVFDSNQLFPLIQKNNADVRKGIYKIVYEVYVYNMRLNISGVNGEINSYSEKYEQLMGEALATVIKSINEDTNEINKDTTGIETFKKDAVQKNKVRINFFKCLQAIDLFLKNFTLSATKVPPLTADVQKILADTQLIANWYSEETGDALATFFELREQLIDEGNPAAAAAAAAAAAPAPAAPGMVATVQLGTAQNVQQQVLGLTPVAQPAAAPAPAVPLVSAIDINKYQTDAENLFQGSSHYYNTEYFANHARLIAPATMTYSGCVDKIERHHEKHYKVLKNLSNSIYERFQGLKNVINLFVRISLEQSGTDDVFMSPNQIYNSLMDYLKVMTFTYDSKQLTSVKVTNVQNVNRSEVSLFSSAITAMATKIITTLRIIEMQKQPISHCDLLKTRIILGGAGDTFEAIPEASEFYFRLPRLAEFYIDLFWISGNQADAPLSISMVPDIEGVFSELIKYIFTYRYDNNNVAFTGNYLDTEISDLVIIINKIYRFYHKDGNASISKCIDDFIKNVNRRYGILTSDERARIKDNLKNVRNNYMRSGTVNNLAILPGENAPSMSDYYTTLAPSDRYLSGKSVTGMKYDLDNAKLAVQKFINVFGEKLDSCKDIRNFKTFIRQNELEIRSAKSEDAKLSCVTNLINSGSSSNRNVIEVFMFHETVLSALDVLKSIREVLAKNFDLNSITLYYNQDFQARNNEAELIYYLIELTASEDDSILDAKIDANGSVRILYNRIKRQCADLIDQTKKFINSFRNTIPYDIIRLYETEGVRIASDAADVKVSLLSLQNDLMEEIFTEDRNKQNSLGSINDRINAAIALFNTQAESKNWHRLIYGDQLEPCTVRLFNTGNGANQEYYWCPSYINKVPDNYNLLGLVKNFHVTLDNYLYAITGNANNFSLSSIPLKSIHTSLITPFFNTSLLQNRRFQTLGVVKQQLNAAAVAALFYVPDGNYACITSSEDSIIPQFIYDTLEAIVRGPDGAALNNAVGVRNAYITNVYSDVPSIMKDILKCKIPMLLNNLKFISGAAEMYLKLIKVQTLESSYIFTQIDPNDTKQNMKAQLNSMLDIVFGAVGSAVSQAAGGVIINRFDQDKTETLLLNNINPLAVLELCMKSDRIIDNLAIGNAINIVYNGGIISAGPAHGIPAALNGSAQLTVANLGIPANAALQATIRSYNDALCSFPHNRDFHLAAANNAQPNTQIFNRQVGRATYENTLKTISQCCKSLEMSLKLAMREIGDNPVFMEMYENHLDTLSMTKKSKDLCMPFSLTNYLANSRIDPDGTSYERVAFSSETFGMLYGARFLLGSDQKVKSGHIPNSIKFLTTFNSLNAENEQISESSFLEFAQNVTNFNRLLFKSTKVNGIFSYNTSHGFTYGHGTPIGNIVTETFSTMTILSKIFGHCYGQSDTGNARNTEHISNIVELNVMPLNIHALMQSIPLINIFNYSSMFNVVFRNIFGENNRTKPSVKHIYDFAVDPYDNNLDFNPYKPDWQMFFMGNDNIVKDRPKFISDQIYLKSLLGTAELQPHNKIFTDTQDIIRKIMKYVDDIFTAHVVNPIGDIAGFIANVKTGGFTFTHMWAIIDHLLKNNQEFYDTVISLGSYPVLHDIIGKFKNAFPFGQDKFYLTRVVPIAPFNSAGLVVPANYGVILNGATVLLRIIDQLSELLENRTTTFAILIPTTDLDTFKRNPRRYIVNAGVDSINVTYSQLSTLIPEFIIKDNNVIITLNYYAASGNDYYHSTGAEVMSVQVPKPLYSSMSMCRFDNIIVRNLVFISTVQRLLRLLINRSINIGNNQLLSAGEIANPSTTEYGHAPFVKFEQINDLPFNSTTKYDAVRM